MARFPKPPAGPRPIETLVSPAAELQSTARQMDDLLAECGYPASHGIDLGLPRPEEFGAFIVAREQRLLRLIARATGHAVVTGDMPPSEGEDVPDDIARDDGLVLLAAE